MQFQGREGVSESMNVIPLFASLDVSGMSYEIEEGPEVNTVTAPKANRLLVSENQFPDQSMYVLGQQIVGLKERLERLKFYLSDLDDLLPG